MTPPAVLVLVAGVLLVLVIAGVAFALDARRRRAARPPAPRRTPPVRQVEPIDSARAQVDPPTVMARPEDGPTVALPRPDRPEEP